MLGQFTENFERKMDGLLKELDALMAEEAVTPERNLAR